MKIAIIDGQGGGIGKHITEKIRKALGDKVEIYALGTNSVATAQMLKAGANEGATGENAIVFTVPRVKLILGSIGIVYPNAMLGELTPKMAEAIANSPAKKILLPIHRLNMELVGISSEPLPHYIEQLIKKVTDYVQRA